MESSLLPAICAALERGESLAVHAIPKASANRIEGYEEDAQGKRWLRVRITAAPEAGKANAALVKFLAKQLGLKASALEVASGAASRYKLLKYNN